LGGATLLFKVMQGPRREWLVVRGTTPATRVQKSRSIVCERRLRKHDGDAKRLEAFLKDSFQRRPPNVFGGCGARNAECYTVSETYWLDLRCESTGTADDERCRRINVQE
jgi:hypothetical protein